jgi:DNA primase
MARIPEEEIERLKSQISLERLAVAKGVKLKKHGENLLGLCPFHDDREPSLVITPDKNLWHCLGACQTGGTVIDWEEGAGRLAGAAHLLGACGNA